MSGRPSARRAAALGGLLAAAYVLSLAALFPAERLWRMIEPQLNALPETSVEGIAGNVWGGRADALRVAGQDLGRLSWRVQPSALLTGWLGFRLRLDSAGDSIALSLRLRPGSLQVREGSGSIAAERLRDAFELPLLLDGRVDVVLARLAFDRSEGFHSLEGSAAWLGAAGGLPQPVPFGSYRAVLEPRGDGSAFARIESAPGSPLLAEGWAAWHPANGYEVDLLLRTEAPSIRSVLETMAAPQTDGAYRLLVDHR